MKHIDRWLLLRRRGSLWGVPHGSLHELTRSGCPRVELKNGTVLLADELLNLTANLESRPFPRSARPFYSEEIFGLAVWRGQPVILVQPEAVPPTGLIDTPIPWRDTHVDET